MKKNEINLYRVYRQSLKKHGKEFAICDEHLNNAFKDLPSDGILTKVLIKTSKDCHYCLNREEKYEYEQQYNMLKR